MRFRNVSEIETERSSGLVLRRRGTSRNSPFTATIFGYSKPEVILGNR
jgi:hypothetical protein